MSVVTLRGADLALPHEEVIALGAKSGLKFKDSHIAEWATLLGSLDATVESILAEEDYTLKPDLSAYPRSDIHIPANADESDHGGWITKVTVKAASPQSDLLTGKTIAIKDNVALAGVRCINGTEAVKWTPEIDATIVTRLLDAGGLITGKSSCENACMEGISDTSCTGKVHNPYADGYSCGGSSSGSGRLVASGKVDMAIGCDQGGSIRIPASMCGIVGLKPTWGLVPYTGILSSEATIDHAGPMTRTVRDCALMLDAIAGPDGIDDRQPPFLPDEYVKYTSHLDSFLSSQPKDKPLAGIKIGVLSEGFIIPGMLPSVANICNRAISTLASFGAETKSISVPLHSSAAEIWMLSLPLSGTRTGLLNASEGRKELHLLDRGILSQIPQEQFDAFGPGAQNLYMRWLYLREKYSSENIHGKCTNLIRRMNDAYDAALAEVDVLVMPTLPSPACKLLDDPAAHGPLERLSSRNFGLVGNTAPYNSTGHPALTVPVGFVSAVEDESVKLPAGLQIVGKKFRDGDCLKVGAVWEREVDWKSF